MLVHPFLFACFLRVYFSSISETKLLGRMGRLTPFYLFSKLLSRVVFQVLPYNYLVWSLWGLTSSNLCKGIEQRNNNEM